MGLDAKWKAESDARALAEAEVIRADQPRLQKARTAAARLQETEKAEAAAMGRVAQGSRTKPKHALPAGDSLVVKLGESY